LNGQVVLTSSAIPPPEKARNIKDVANKEPIYPFRHQEVCVGKRRHRGGSRTAYLRKTNFNPEKIPHHFEKKVQGHLIWAKGKEDIFFFN
jgi:hypothetical protein